MVPFCKLLTGHLFRWPVFQQELQVSVNIQVMCFYHLNHSVDHYVGIGAIHRITEQPSLAANRKWTDSTAIVRKAAEAGLQIGFCGILPVKGVIRCLIHAGIADGALLIQP